ncbi:hypothetical protein [Deinococcus aetherius]|uniref:hypothetical protein n=1 Tax=Deinococcus aetherius TaxID=200252 RepID=UPI0031EDD592
MTTRAFYLEHEDGGAFPPAPGSAPPCANPTSRLLVMRFDDVLQPQVAKIQIVSADSLK